MAPAGVKHHGLGRLFHHEPEVRVPVYHTVARKFPWGPIIRGALLATATAMDVEGTQRCLNEQPNAGCVSGNPMVSTNPRVVWPVEMSISAGAVLTDFECWKKGQKYCWSATVIGTGAHTAGAVTGWTK